MPDRTLWEQGRHPGRLVVRALVLGLALVTAVDVLLTGSLGTLFDVFFVLACVTAALWVHPRDFFVVGVLPPLMLAGFVVVLTFVDRAAVARAEDPIAQALVSGLAHHAVPLVIAYGLTLALLALRQVALRHHGTLRVRARPSRVLTPEQLATQPATQQSTQPATQPSAEAASEEEPEEEPARVPAQQVRREPAPPPGDLSAAPAEAQR